MFYLPAIYKFRWSWVCCHRRTSISKDDCVSFFSSVVIICSKDVGSINYGQQNKAKFVSHAAEFINVHLIFHSSLARKRPPIVSIIKNMNKPSAWSANKFVFVPINSPPISVTTFFWNDMGLNLLCSERMVLWFVTVAFLKSRFLRHQSSSLDALPQWPQILGIRVQG